MNNKIYLKTNNKSLSYFSNLIEKMKKKSTNSDFFDTYTEIQQIIDYYEVLISCMPGNIYWMDTEGKTVGCNQNVLDMFGLKSLTDFTGLTFEDMTKIGHWEQHQGEKFKIDSQQVIKKGLSKINIEEPPIPNTSGENIYFLSNRVPLYNNNQEIIGFIGISTDITQLKKTQIALSIEKQKAETASHAKSEFIANMSHDLRTPITGMLGLAQSWQMTADNDAHRHDAGLLIDTINELLNLLNEILHVINLENGQIKGENKPFAIHSLIHHNITLLKSVAHHKGIKLSYEVMGCLPEWIKLNRIYLDRCLLNLLSNAIKFTPKGSVRLSVSMLSVDKKSPQLKIEIIDTGIGIPQDKLETIFENFSRLSTAYQGIYKGYGIGLYTVKQYAKAMNGSIKVTSQLGKGSTFTLTVPFKIAKAAASPTSHQTNEEKPPLSSSAIREHKEINIKESMVDNPIAQVMVVEDNPLAARMAQQILLQAQCDSDWTTSGEDALIALKKKSYDLILMDIGLPDIDGLQVSQSLRQIESYQDTPIIALTGHLSDKKKATCLSSGINELITKPLSLNIIQRILKQFQLNQSTAPIKLTNDSDDEPLLKRIDLEEGTRLAGGNQQNAEHMISMLIKTLPKELKVMRHAYETKNNKQLDKLLHKFYGGLCYCGLPRLREATKVLHQALLEKKIDQIPSLFTNLQKEMEVLGDVVNSKKTIINH